MLAANARIELVLVDGAKPVESIACVFLATRGVPTANPLSSGPDGRVSLTGLTPEIYRIRCSHPDYWTVEQDTEAKADASPVPVQIRRLGDVTIQVLASSGLPVKDVPIELRSLEFDTSVLDWVVAGRAKGPTEFLTDVRGEITLSGLPHGAYDWRATLIDGSQLEGSLTVVPGQKSRVPILCP